MESRVVAARGDQVVAERGGRELQDDCDKASAEEMVCAMMKAGKIADLQASFSDTLLLFLDRDEYIWRGVYNDTRFDRHVRSYAKKLLKMAKTNDGFENTTHYQ
nr:hypothetical protein [Sphingomonas sp. CFBP 13728]